MPITKRGADYVIMGNNQSGAGRGINPNNIGSPYGSSTIVTQFGSSNRGNTNNIGSPYGKDNIQGNSYFGTQGGQSAKDTKDKFAGVNTTKLGSQVQDAILGTLGTGKSMATISTTRGAMDALGKAGRDINAQTSNSVYQAGMQGQGAAQSAQQQAQRGILDAISKTHLGLADVAAQEYTSAIDQGSRLLEQLNNNELQWAQLEQQGEQFDAQMELQKDNLRLQYLTLQMEQGLWPELLDEINDETIESIFDSGLSQETKNQIKAAASTKLAKTQAKEWVESSNIDAIDFQYNDADGFYYMQGDEKIILDNNKIEALTNSGVPLNDIQAISNIDFSGKSIYEIWGSYYPTGYQSSRERIESGIRNNTEVKDYLNGINKATSTQTGIRAISENGIPILDESNIESIKAQVNSTSAVEKIKGQDYYYDVKQKPIVLKTSVGYQTYLAINGRLYDSNGLEIDVNKLGVTV